MKRSDTVLGPSSSQSSAAPTPPSLQSDLLSSPIASDQQPEEPSPQPGEAEADCYACEHLLALPSCYDGMFNSQFQCKSVPPLSIGQYEVASTTASCKRCSSVHARESHRPNAALVLAL